jgi:hypothetical protein
VAFDNDDKLCVEPGCFEKATFWVLPIAHHRPVMCERHAAEYLQATKAERERALREREPRDPAEDHLAEVDAIRARLRVAEDVCYQAQALLAESLSNADLRVPALRAALRKWAAATKGL